MEQNTIISYYGPKFVEKIVDITMYRIKLKTAT